MRKNAINLSGLLLLCAVFLPSGAAAGELLRATLNVIAYGYKVEVIVNGTRLDTISGGKSQSTQLFDEGHPMKSKAAPSFKNNFVLKPGKNRILIKYTHVDKQQQNPPLFSLFAPAYSSNEPIFRFEPEQAGSGQIDEEFEIYKVQPNAFKTRTL